MSPLNCSCSYIFWPSAVLGITYFCLRRVRCLYMVTALSRYLHKLLCIFLLWQFNVEILHMFRSQEKSNRWLLLVDLGVVFPFCVSDPTIQYDECIWVVIDKFGYCILYFSIKCILKLISIMYSCYFINFNKKLYPFILATAFKLVLIYPGILP